MAEWLGKVDALKSTVEEPDWRHPAWQRLVWDFELVLDDSSERRAVQLAGAKCSHRMVNGRRYRISGKEEDGLIVAEAAEDLDTLAVVRFGVDYDKPSIVKRANSEVSGRAQEIFPWHYTFKNGEEIRGWDFELAHDEGRASAVRIFGDRCSGQIVDGNRYKVNGLKNDGITVAGEAEDLDRHIFVECKGRISG